MELNGGEFCLQDLVPASTAAAASDASRVAGPPHTNQPRQPDPTQPTGHDNTANAFDTSSANSAYRFPSMQPFGCPSSAGHFMTQPVQPLPLGYPQVSHIPNSVHSAYGHSQQPAVGFNSMSGGGLRHHTGHSVHHAFDTDGSDFFDKTPLQSSAQTGLCAPSVVSSKIALDDKRKGEHECRASNYATLICNCARTCQKRAPACANMFATPNECFLRFNSFRAKSDL